MVVAASILATCGPASAGGLEAAVPVSTVVVSRHAIKRTLDLTGGVEAFRRVTVYSRVTGVIQKLPVELGMKLRRGDVVAVVEHETELAQRKELVAAVEAAKAGVRRAEAAVGVAQAKLQQAEAQLENAAIEKTRAENLYRDDSIPRQKYDAAMARYKIAVAGRNLAVTGLSAARAALAQAKVGSKQAEAALHSLDTRIADYTIRAPISGVVSAKFVDEGAMDSPSLPIVEIIDTSLLKVKCDLAQVDSARVREGQEVEITTDAYPGMEFYGKVAVVNPSLNPITRTLPLEIHTTGRPSGENGREEILLKPGLFVKLSIKIGEKTTTAVPRDCLMRLPGTGVYYLFVVKDGKARKRTVEIGIGRGNLVEIVSGVKEGERIVIRGQTSLKTGTPVIEAM